MTLKNLPVFPDSLTPVTELLEFCREGDSVVYFFKNMPVFTHAVQDIVTFHMITAQFCVKGHATEEDIVRAFGVEAEGVRLAVELYSVMGVDGFYPTRVRVEAKSRVNVGNKRKRKAQKSG